MSPLKVDELIRIYALILPQGELKSCSGCSIPDEENSPTCSSEWYSSELALKDRTFRGDPNRTGQLLVTFILESVRNVLGCVITDILPDSTRRLKDRLVTTIS